MNAEPGTVAEALANLRPFAIESEGLAKLRASFTAGDAFAATFRDNPNLAALRKAGEAMSASPAMVQLTKLLRDPAYVRTQARIAEALRNVPKLPAVPNLAPLVARAGLEPVEPVAILPRRVSVPSPAAGLSGYYVAYFAFVVSVLLLGAAVQGGQPLEIAGCVLAAAYAFKTMLDALGD